MISIIGAGAWGTALAIIARRAGHEVTIWALETEVADAINSKGENLLYLPGQKLDPHIKATSILTDVANAKSILIAVPAQHMRQTLQPLVSQLPTKTPLVICSKGIEQNSSALMSNVVSELFSDNPILVLSGPTFAMEVAEGKPTAVTLAAEDTKAAKQISSLLGSQRFRPYSSNDIIGAQIGGAVKNVLAIACGIADGRGLGNNARSALITRGLAELLRLCIAKGGRADTLMGLSGLGDLVLTCTSPQSRNYSLGVALGQNQALTDIMKEKHSIVEGVFTAGAAAELGNQLTIDMPIINAVDDILNHGKDIDVIIGNLLARPLRPEAD